jgi:hypothetical protein
MSAKAGGEARRQFGRARMIEDYLSWFDEILRRQPSEVRA